jgi:exodeoxyribonuclease VII small subunit
MTAQSKPVTTDPPLPPLSFTEAATELDTIVTQLRTPGLPLETALGQFERGVLLVQVCQAVLKQTTGKLQQLTDTLDVLPLTDS